MTIKTTLIAAGAIIAASFATAPAANAGDLTVQFAFGNGHGYHGYQNYNHYENRRFVSERRIHRILRHNGFRSTDIWRKGPFYVAKAYDHRGRAFKIRLSAFDGDIIAVNRIGRGHGHWN